MNRALSALGYRVSPDSWKLLTPVLHQDWEQVAEHIDRYDAFEDNPIPQIFKELDAMYPDSKFILTVRDSDSWYKSVKYHIDNLRSPMHEWVFGRGRGIPAQNMEHTIRIYEEHIKEVRDYFKNRSDDLLVYDLKEHNNWSALCEFLGLPIPEAEYPHANRSNYKTPKYAGKKLTWRRIRKRVKNPILIFYYNLRGWIPTR